MLIGLHVTHAPVEAARAWNWTWMVTNLAALLAMVSVPGHPGGCGGPSERASPPFSFWPLSARSLPARSGWCLPPRITTSSCRARCTRPTSLEPRFYTTRGTTHYFAHPPLAHLYVAGSFLYYDRWRELAFYDHSPAASPPDLDAQYAHDVEQPYRLETRTPNVFLGALAVARLGGMGGVGRAAPAFACLLALAYVFCPEVFVRSSYGGYFAIGNFVLMEIARPKEDRARASSARLCLPRSQALSRPSLDHKLMVVVAALVLWEALRMRSTPMEAAGRALRHPTLSGSSPGPRSSGPMGSRSVRARSGWTTFTTTWWTGSSTGRPGTSPSWADIRVFPLSGSSSRAIRAGCCCRSRSRPLPSWAGEKGLRCTTGFWLAWTAVTAVAFSLVDWRQTKHLVILTLPLYLAPARAAGEGRAVRVAIVGVLALLLAWNLRTIALLAANFGALPKAPEW